MSTGGTGLNQLLGPRLCQGVTHDIAHDDGASTRDERLHVGVGKDRSEGLEGDLGSGSRLQRQRYVPASCCQQKVCVRVPVGATTTTTLPPPHGRVAT